MKWSKRLPNIHPYVVNQRNAFRPCAGNTWTTNHSSDGRVLDAGGSEIGVLPSLVLLQLIRMMHIRHATVKVELRHYWKRLELALTSSSCDSCSGNSLVFCAWNGTAWSTPFHAFENCFRVCNMPIRKMRYKYTTLWLVMFSIHIVRKHAMLESYSHCDWSPTSQYCRHDKPCDRSGVGSSLSQTVTCDNVVKVSTL